MVTIVIDDVFLKECVIFGISILFGLSVFIILSLKMDLNKAKKDISIIEKRYYSLLKEKQKIEDELIDTRWDEKKDPYWKKNRKE